MSAASEKAITYRLVRADDAAAIAAIYAPYVKDTVITFETEAPDANEIRTRLDQIGARYPWIIAEREGSVVGYAYASEYRTRRAYRWSVDTAVYLLASMHRQGIGRGLYERLFALLRAQGYVNAYGGITLPNAASIGLHEAVGFVPVGIYRHVGYKHGAWHDVGWWQCALANPPSEPPEPVPFPAIDRDIVRAALNP